MICASCKAAGQYLIKAKALSPEDPPFRASLRFAADLHKQCEHPDTCACHHHLDLYAWQ